MLYRNAHWEHASLKTIENNELVDKQVNEGR